MRHAIKITNASGESRVELWERTKLFCPGCGQRKVWHDTGAGDYYVGEAHMCASCGVKFHLPGGLQEQPAAPSADDYEVQVYAQLPHEQTQTT